MVDEVLRGIAGSDFADVLFRAAAFARVVATGRAALDDGQRARGAADAAAGRAARGGGPRGARARSRLSRVLSSGSDVAGWSMPDRERLTARGRS